MKGSLPELGPFTYPTLVWWYPAVVSGIFSVIYATHKIHSLKCTEIRLDAEHVSPEWLEDRLLAFGYLPTEHQGVYTAGFRADYWMAPSIKVRKEGTDIVVSGPTFYLRKLMRSYKRATWLKKARGRLRKNSKKSR